MVDIESLRAKWLEYKNNGQPYQDRWGVCTRELQSLLDAIETLMAERKPDMADWVAAACRSKLASPKISGDADRLCFEFDEEKDCVGEWWACMAIVSDSESAFIQRHGSPSKAYESPQELRDALDLIAIEHANEDEDDGF